jgi:amino acid transporter
MALAQPGGRLRRVLTLRDLILFNIVAVMSLRWIAVAAANGPSAIVIWIIAFAAFFVPLALCVVEMSSRFPQEGGLYYWTKHAFGDFAGFVSGWSYWTSNLPYFPGVLYFAASNALFIGGGEWSSYNNSGEYFIIFSLVGLALAAALNIVGLNVGKWLHNVGSVCVWVPAALLLVMGLVAWWKFGAATPLEAASFAPKTGLREIVFWSTIAFAFGGLEAGPIMGEEIENPRRNLPRSIFIGGAVVTLVYVFCTLSILLALPFEQVSGMAGITEAISATSQKVGAPQIGPLAAVLITVGSLGGVGAWLATTSRLPFVIGVDKRLPSAFARIHPKWGTPYVAILTQVTLAAVFAILGKAGTTVEGAYEVLVGTVVITFFVPYLFMFAALIKVQNEPAGANAVRVPGGKPVAIVLGVLGFLSTAASIFLAAVPPEDAKDPRTAVLKVVGLSLILLGAGVVVYFLGGRRPAAKSGRQRFRGRSRRRRRRGRK